MTHLGSFESRTRDPLRDRQPLRLVDPSNPCRCGRRIASSEEAGILRRDSLPVARHPREEVREWIEPVAEQLDDVAAIGPLYRFDRFKAPEACGRTCGTATRTCSRPADAPVQGRVQPRPRPHAGALASRARPDFPSARFTRGIGDALEPLELSCPSAGSMSPASRCHSSLG